MPELTRQRCVPCTPGTPALSREEVQKLLPDVSGFALEADSTRLARTFTFTDYYETLAFVNAVAWIAHREDHHPDLEVGYRTCRVVYTTHAASGLTKNDFICAAKVNALLA